MATYTGNPVNDTLTGTTDSDLFIASGGNDVYNGGGGNGGDTLDYTGAGQPIRVTLTGASTGNAVKSATEIDTFIGIVAFKGTSGGDLLIGFGGQTGGIVQLSGMAGNDTINGAGTSWNQADYSASQSGVTVNLGTGIASDSFGGTDTLLNVLRVRGSGYADSLTGGTGDDWFSATTGNDTIDGGAGRNALDYNWIGGVIALTMTGNGSGTAVKSVSGTDSFSRISVVQSGAGNDLLVGFAGATTDTIFVGGFGNDTINGAGNTHNIVTYSFYPTSAGVSVNLAASTATDGAGGTDQLLGVTALQGSDFNDSITGASAAERFLASLGSDLYVGGGGNDLLDYSQFFSGAIAVTFTSATGGTVTKGIGGAAGVDTFSGFGRIGGTSDIDTLTGGAGNDTFIGSASNDIIDGGAGRDTLDFTSLGFRGTGITVNGDGSVGLLVSLGLDRLTRIEEVDFIDGRLVFDPTDPAAQVTRLYQAALHRTPDQGGLNGWIFNLQHGSALTTLANGFLGSAEFTSLYGANLSDSGFITQLYVNVLGRAPDAAGAAGWLAALSGGTLTRADVLIGFSESPENIANLAPVVQAGIWDRNEVATQVARLYDAVLGRLPDAAGLNSWKTAIENGQVTLAQATDGFTGSTEFQAVYGTLNDSQFVTALYNNALHRTPDPTGLATWVNALGAHTVTRSGVVLGFSESAEHIANTADAIQSDTPGHFGILFA